MAIANFKPTIWSADLHVTLEKALVYGAPGVVNRNYEGEIRAAGDKVNITSLTDPTIGTYTAHTDITIEDVDDDTQQLVVDQAKYFAFEVDDIEKRQALGGVMTEQARKAAYKLRDTADTFLGALMGAATTPGAEVTVTSSNAYDILVDLSVALSQANVPTEGRFAVITPAYHGFLLKDSRFVAAGDEIGAGVRANGLVGRAAGLSLRVSNNAPAGPGAGAGKLVIAGYDGATTFAEQIASVEAARLEKRFADMVKGLHLYGAKVTRAAGLVSRDVIGA